MAPSRLCASAELLSEPAEAREEELLSEHAEAREEELVAQKDQMLSQYSADEVEGSCRAVLQQLRQHDIRTTLEAAWLECWSLRRLQTWLEVWVLTWLRC
jgi:hypothetical protein